MCLGENLGCFWWGEGEFGAWELSTQAQLCVLSAHSVATDERILQLRAASLG